MKDTERSKAHHVSQEADVQQGQQNAGPRTKAPFIPPTLERHEDLPKLTGSEFNFSV